MNTLHTSITVGNWISVAFPSRSENESLARVVVASFAAQLDPTMEELTELKTAVSEAVTNSILHGYPDRVGEIRIFCRQGNGTVEVRIEDDGVGINHLDEAMQPMFTSRPDLERSGMGLSVMENFVDEMTIESTPGVGTVVRLRKTISTPERPS